LLSDLKFYFVHLFSNFMSYILFGSLFLVRGVILYFASLLVLLLHACLFLGIYLSSIDSVYNRIYLSMHFISVLVPFYYITSLQLFSFSLRIT